MTCQCKGIPIDTADSVPMCNVLAGYSHRYGVARILNWRVPPFWSYDRGYNLRAVILVMLSIPPPMPALIRPRAIVTAILVIACKPEEQARFTVKTVSRNEIALIQGYASRLRASELRQNGANSTTWTFNGSSPGKRSRVPLKTLLIY